MSGSQMMLQTYYVNQPSIVQRTKPLVDIISAVEAALKLGCILRPQSWLQRIESGLA